MPLINLNSLNSSATISDFGAWLTKFSIGKVHILMPGYEYEQDGKTKRRGGLPVLFPNAGKSIESGNLKLPQHGFARDVQWQITYKSDNEMVLALKDTKETFDQFPFHFSCNLTYLLNDNSLNIALAVTNNSSNVMPIAPGFHPYFNLSKEKRDMFIYPSYAGLQLGALSKQLIGSYTTRLKSYCEFSRLQYHRGYTRANSFASGINPINDFQFDGTTKYVKSQSPLKFELPDVGKILLTYSDEFKNLSYWAQPDGNFICIEPWVGGEGAIINSSELIQVKPKQTLELKLVISLIL